MYKRRRREIYECKDTLVLSEPVIVDQEEAFANVLQAKEDEILELLAEFDTSYESKIESSAPIAKAALELHEAVKGRLESARFSLSECIALMEMEKTAQEELVATTLQQLGAIRRMRQLDLDTADSKTKLFVYATVFTR